jgi:hypothetical protein
MIQIFYKYMIIDGQILSHEKMGHSFTVNREFSQKEKKNPSETKEGSGWLGLVHRAEAVDGGQHHST